MKKNLLNIRLSMNQKIFCITTLILLSSILITGAFVQNHFRTLYSESIDKAVQLIIQKYSSTIVDYFYRAEAFGNTLNAEIPSFFPQLDEETDIFENYRNYLRLEGKMNSLCEAVFGRDSAYRCYLLLDSGIPMSSMFRSPESVFSYKNSETNQTPFSILSDEALRDQGWFQTTEMLKGAAYWFSAFDNSHSICSARNLNSTFMVNDKAMNYVLGTLVVGIDISRITESFDNNTFGDNLGFFITDSEYRIVYAREASLINLNLGNLIEEEDIFSYSADMELSVTMNGIPCRLWKQSLPGDMQLVSFLPVQTLNMQLRENLQLILIVFAVVLMAEVILTAVFSRIITYPIRKLSTHMKDTSVPTIIPCDYQSKDEIGILYHTFNEMVEKNERLIQQIYDYSEQQKKLKYQMLQAQINPHFLYNVLDSVSCAALINGEEQLSDILSSLSVSLRYNINQPDQLVTLGDELKMVNDYIAIQQFRCDNRIRFTCEVLPEAAAARLPKTILQPLLENGIQYGSANADGYRYVSIQGDCDIALQAAHGRNRSLVSIRISNEHNNMELSLEEEVERLNNYLKGNCELRRSGSGLGILNVQQRIQLVFGDQFGIHYERSGNYLDAVILLPFFD